MYDYDVYSSMMEAYDEALAVDYPCAESEDDGWYNAPWESDTFDLDFGFDPYEGCYTYDC